MSNINIRSSSSQRDSSRPRDSSQQQQQPNKKKEKNVFIYMETTIQTKSPKSILYKSIEENRRIKVWTRSHTYVRSVCTGYLVAFDRYWNLAMIDVDEIFKIPNKTKKNKTIEAVATATDDDKQDLELLASSDNKPPIFARELLHLKSKRYTLCHRHVNQLFIRGDNVVMVAYADKDQ